MGKTRRKRGGEIEKRTEGVKLDWARENCKPRSLRYPATTVYLYPHPHGDTFISSYPNLEEEYLVLEKNKNNNTCVDKPMPLVKYICTGKTPTTRKINPSRKLDTSTLDFHGRTNKAGCSYNLPHSSAPDPSNHQENSYLSDFGDFDEGSEANRKNYATIALKKLNSLKTRNPSLYKGELDLVECGPIALGYSSDGLILHLNFKARNIDVNDASVETYFIELVKSDSNDVQLVCLRCLGPSSSLPDKAKTFGCLYCSSHNIHHPDVTLRRYPSFHNGREDCWTTLESQILNLREFTRKNKKEGIVCMFSHPGLKYFGRYYHAAPNALAAVALSLFNSRTKGLDFKLVKLGSSGRRDTSLGWLVHLNFEAKNKRDPDSPLQTFFAEVIRSSFFIFATFCECLGRSDFVLCEEPNKHGCTFCVRSRVHHPAGPGYTNAGGYRKIFLRSSCQDESQVKKK